MRIKNLFAAAILFAVSVTAGAQRYCNPLPMPIGDGGNASGDVSVIEDGGKYYMYCSGGGAWVSSDLYSWEFHKVDHIPVAPDVCKYNGKFYLTGNSDHIFVADNPLGPFEDMGGYKNTGTPDEGWRGGFDTKMFVDDDNQPYLFWPGRGVSGIYGVKLDPNDVSKFVGKPVHLFGFNPMHKWERYGDANEYPTVAWIEGPWIIKRNGIYYIEYSASGTQWKTYAQGYYTATSPLGPYTYAPNNPLTRRTDGFVTGPGHGSIIKGPDGNWWQFYTIVLQYNGRRIGMDKITFDENGLMSCEVTDTPQLAPLAKPAANYEQSVPVSLNKISISDSHSSVSSEEVGYPGSFASDNFSRTEWRPKANDPAPSFTIDLSPATRFDVVQTFIVDSFRVLFSGTGRGFSTAAALPVYKYKVEVSMDGKIFTTVLDKTANTDCKNTIFEEFRPLQCRYIRFTITDWPKSAPLGVLEFTAYGKPGAYFPAEEPTPLFSKIVFQ